MRSIGTEAHHKDGDAAGNGGTKGRIKRSPSVVQRQIECDVALAGIAGDRVRRVGERERARRFVDRENIQRGITISNRIHVRAIGDDMCALGQACWIR